ncbi:transposase family protein [Crocosphaera chwakensis]|uniref:transposase family protein n=1 Tax=Crocosphaera chwakensis TaxID=2546361 RepID=UPI001E3E24FF|nr:transposase family protein [Crocosphaera chwakensis]
MTTPHKRAKNGELTENQIEENKALSSNRIFVEHLIRIVKVFKVVQERRDFAYTKIDINRFY